MVEAHERHLRAALPPRGRPTRSGRAAGPDSAEGLLMVAMNVKPEAEADFNAGTTRSIFRALLQ